MVSEAVSFGTVQVPPDGNPIILLADRQTTGGYPRIAHIISADLPIVSQIMPGEHVQFEPVSPGGRSACGRTGTAYKRTENENEDGMADIAKGMNDAE